MDRSIWPFRPILDPSTSLFGIFHVQGGKQRVYRYYSYIHVQLQQASVLDVNSSQSDLFPGKNLDFSLLHSKVVFEQILQICGNGLLKIACCTGYITTHKTSHAISLISPSKSSSSSNTSNSDPISCILRERETRFASGMERDLSDVSQSFRHIEIFETQPGKFGWMDRTPYIPPGAVNKISFKESIN